VVLNTKIAYTPVDSVSSESMQKVKAKENAEKADKYGGKRFLGYAPTGGEVWVSMEIDRETLDLKVNFTHELGVLLKEGAVLCAKRITLKKGSNSPHTVEDLIRRSSKNMGGNVTIATLRHITRLKNAVDMKYDKAYYKGKPTALLFTYVSNAIFHGDFDMERGDTSWSYIKNAWNLPKEGDYFTVESIPLFEDQVFEAPVVIEPVQEEQVGWPYNA